MLNSYNGLEVNQKVEPKRLRPRVLLLAAACKPHRGSDSAVGWGRALEAAKRFDTWVICGHWDKEEINGFLAEHGAIPGLHFCFLKRSWIEEFLRIGRPLYDIHYLPYHLWHRRAFKLAVRLHRELRFDLVHQVSRVGYREPGYLWKLDVPFIWGPMGGTQNYPWRFLRFAGIKGAIKEGVRSVLNLLQLRLSPRVRKAAQKATRVIAANSETQRDFARAHGIKPVILLDCGLNAIGNGSSPRNRTNGPLRILWCGKFQHHKGLPLLIQALSQMPPEVQYELRILGAGPMERRWQGMARARGVESQCQWLGWLKQDEVMRQYDWADVLVFTSLRETSGNVILEALSRGLPVICLDHQGPGDIVTQDCGVKILVSTPTRVIKSLRDTLCTLAEERARLHLMSGFALTRAREYLWNDNGEQMARIYYAALEENSKQPG